MIMKTASRHFTQNPVLLHELRARMRGARSFWILLAYLGILAVTMGFAAIAAHASYAESGMEGASGPLLFAVLIGTQAILIALIAPSLTSGAITLEREHQTYEMLATSRMDAPTLVLGKLAASLSFLMLCLVASMPVVMVAAAYGGLAPDQVVSAYLILVLEAAVFGALGIFWSAVVRSTIVATVLSLPSVLLASLGLLPFGMAAVIATQESMRPQDGAGFAVLGSLSPFVAGVVGQDGVPFFNLQIPFWLPAAILAPIIVALLISLAARRLELVTPSRRSLSIPLATVLISVLTLLLTGGLLSPKLVAYKPSELWATLLCILIAATPLVVAPLECKVRSPWRFLRSGRSGILTSVLWTVVTAGIVVAGFFATVHLVKPDEMHDAFKWMPDSLALIVSIVALQITLTLAVSRASGNRVIGMVMALLIGAAIAAYPLYLATITRGVTDLWDTMYLSPVPLPFHVGGPHFQLSPTMIYACSSVILFCLSLLPNRWHGKAAEGH